MHAVGRGKAAPLMQANAASTQNAPVIWNSRKTDAQKVTMRDR